MYRETHIRSLVKTMSWRLLATAATTLLVLAMGGSLELALSVGSMEIVGKLVLYFFHERAWSRVTWGRVLEMPLAKEEPEVPGSGLAS